MAADNFEALLEYAFANCPKGEENSWAYNASCSALAEEFCTEAGNAAQLLSGGYENILEINGHYGAFTAVLAKKCRRHRMQGGKKSSKKNKRLVKASMTCSTVSAGSRQECREDRDM